MLSGGELAGLIVAVGWVVLVVFLAYVLVKLARLLTETTKMVADIGEHTGPLLDDVTQTVAQANEQLGRLDTITKHLATVTENVAGLTSTVSAVVGGPLVKLAAFSYGVRKAVGERREAEVLRAERRKRRKGRS
jgi:uncharacterized protein YoxC